MKQFGLIIFFLLLLGCYGLSAQAPKYSNEFLSLGIGAPALAMSNSIVAKANDVTAGYWNPAGLLNVPAHRQLGLMHAEYFAGIAKYDYAALAARSNDSSAICFSYIRFAVDNIPNTTDLIDAQGNIDYSRITTFTASDNAFIVSYARHLPVKGLSVGINAKIIRRKVGDFGGSWGFGFDLASQYHYNNWCFGAVLRDATSTFNAWSYTFSDRMIEVYTLTGNEIPKNTLELTLPRLLLGAGQKLKLSSSFAVYPEVDFDLTFDGKRNVLIKSNFLSVDPHAGFEIGYKDFVFFRAGVGNFQKETNPDGVSTTFQPNIGIGLNIRNSLIVDYALTDIGNSSIALYSHVFSVKLNFNRIGLK